MSTREKQNSADTVLENDEAELARMGYKQELKRDLGLLQMSFSIISVMTGIPSLFAYGLNTGGPAVMVWGWIIVCGTFLLAERTRSYPYSRVYNACGPGHGRCVLLLHQFYGYLNVLKSAHPTSGGPYFWAAMLSSPEDAPLLSWITGWFNLLGQVAVTTGISFGCASFISTICTFNTDFEPTPNTQIGIYAAVLVSQGLINTFGVHLLHHLNNISVWWHAAGTFSVVVAILAKAPTHQSAHFVFQTFLDGTGGWAERASPAYVAVIGYTLTGFDASAHMTEETRNAAMSGSLGIIMAIGVSALLGWYLILGLLFSIQNLDRTLDSPSGQPVAQIFIDTVGVNGAIALMVVVIGCMYFCGTFSITSNSRMMYAFARDGGIPGSQFFAYVNTKWKSPIRTGMLAPPRLCLEICSDKEPPLVWLACTLSFILGLPSLGSTVAFSAATSIATIGLYTSYGIPIALRIVYHQKFVKGPFHLHKFSFPVAITAVLWIAFISIVFILPQVNPVDSQTLNYSIVAVGIVIIYSVGFWLLSARKWFTGPVKQIAAEEMGINVMEPGTAEKVEEMEREKARSKA
ncbi:amino acid permease [Moniliophthora roreri]|nr:amino acid permease [Moniliophthora roreri]